MKMTERKVGGGGRNVDKDYKEQKKKEAHEGE